MPPEVGWLLVRAVLLAVVIETFWMGVVSTVYHVWVLCN